jgi:mitochondrial fission protein ELM1
VEDVDAEWLVQKLATTATVWVTEDSVNMLYEALTAGAATGLLSMPRRKERASKRNLGGGLLAEGLVTSFDDWYNGRQLTPPAVPLDEAGRCAFKWCRSSTAAASSAAPWKWRKRWWAPAIGPW